MLPDDPHRRAAAGGQPVRSPQQIGHDIVTASGTTLLGADDKAGVAEIVTRRRVPDGASRDPARRRPHRLHAGRGDRPRREALRRRAVRRRCAYTLDGGSRGEVESESFSADAMTVTFHGFNTHPGYAKGRMVNAIKVAADFIHRLPADRLSPETTDGYEGFVHPYVLQAGVDRTAVRLIVRDFDTAGLARKEALVEQLARETVGAPSRRARRDRRSRSSTGTWRGARPASRGRRVRVRGRPARGPRGPIDAIRGGTDGSRLSFMGLPTPNIFAGEHNFHSRLEWVSRAGHGEGRRGDRRTVPGLGGAGAGVRPMARRAGPSTAARPVGRPCRESSRSGLFWFDCIPCPIKKITRPALR